MTLKDIFNAIRTGLNSRGDIENSIYNGDFARDGGYMDQFLNGDLIANEGRYVDEAGRVLAGIDSKTGEGAQEGYAGLVSSGAKVSSDQQEAFNNLLSTEATNSARDWEKEMRDTEILSSASQLQSLGLSPSGLAGAVAGHSGVAAANVGRGNPAMDRYNRRMGIARSLLGLAAGMASSGIHGAFLSSVKNAAGKVSVSAAHTAKNVSNNFWQPNDMIYKGRPYTKKTKNSGYISDEEWNKLFE